MDADLVKWSQVTPLVLGALNPPQVGTSMTGKYWQKKYGKGKTWQKVKEWLYSQNGKCEKCGTRLQLESAHRPGYTVNDLGKTKSADVRYVRLLCKRHNVAERPSHKKGGLTFLTAESALIWLLLNFKPKTYKEYEKMCRDYGLTMANIRFQEAWAFAVWLSREGLYTISDE